jgi:hypothetical protein
MSPTSVSGGFQFQRSAVGITPASLKRSGSFFVKRAKNLSVKSCYKEGVNIGDQML